MQHRQPVNTPTDSTATLTLKPLTHSEMNSTSGTNNTSERLQQWEICQNGNSAIVGNLQTTPGHHMHIHSNEPKKQEETKSNSNVSQSLKKGLVHNSDDISRKDSHQIEEISPLPKPPVEVHEAVVDMKVVNSRHSLLSQVSLRQRDSPRTQDKPAAIHDGNVELNLQIEGQAVRLSSENSGRRQNKVITAQKEYYAASSSQSHNIVRQESEKQSHKPGSLTSLSIRPVSLQQPSRKVSASAAPVRENDRNVNFTERSTADLDQSTCIETLEVTTGAQETDEVAQFSGNTTGIDSLSTHEKKNNSTSNNSCQPTSTVDLKSIEQENDETSGLNSKDNSTADETKEKSTVTSGNIILHATPGGSSTDKNIITRRSPIVFVRESSPTPVRSYSTRPSSSHQKSLSLR